MPRSVRPQMRGYRRRYQKAMFRNSVARIVKRMRETKHTSHTTTVYDPIPVAGKLISLTELSEGDGSANRDGDQVYLQKVFAQHVFRYAFDASGTDAGGKPIPAVRMLLVQSKQGALTISDMPLFEEPANTDKMYVLKDNLVQMNNSFQYTLAGTDTIAGGTTRYKLKYNKFRNNLLQYNGASMQDPLRNAVYLYYCHSSDSATAVEFAGFTQMFFKEK